MLTGDGGKYFQVEKLVYLIVVCQDNCQNFPGSSGG